MVNHCLGEENRSGIQRFDWMTARTLMKGRRDRLGKRTLPAMTAAGLRVVRKPHHCRRALGLSVEAGIAARPVF